MAHAPTSASGPAAEGEARPHFRPPVRPPTRVKWHEARVGFGVTQARAPGTRLQPYLLGAVPLLRSNMERHLLVLS